MTPLQIVDEAVVDQVELSQQRNKFLAFNRKSDEGRRDYAMAVCLIDLGLRAIEVSRLRVADINGGSRVVTVPAAKASAGRQLPLPRPVGMVLRDYLHHRPHTEVEPLFVGQTVLRGRPATRNSQGTSRRNSWSSLH